MKLEYQNMVESKQEVDILKLELAKTKERISKLDDKFIDGDIDKQTHNRMIEKYTKEVIQLNKKIETMLTPNRTNIELILIIKCLA